MSIKSKRYDESYKRSAVKLFLDSGKTIAAISRDLGVSKCSFRIWIDKYSTAKERVLATTPPNSNPYIEENKRLKKELAQMQLEHEILKKAAAYFTHRYFLL